MILPPLILFLLVHFLSFLCPISPTLFHAILIVDYGALDLLPFLGGTWHWDHHQWCDSVNIITFHWTSRTVQCRRNQFSGFDLTSRTVVMATMILSFSYASQITQRLVVVTGILYGVYEGQRSMWQLGSSGFCSGLLHSFDHQFTMLQWLLKRSDCQLYTSYVYWLCLLCSSTNCDYLSKKYLW